MDIHLVLAAISAFLALASCVPYVRDIFYGTTRPNAVTWFLWLFIQAIAIAAQISGGASWSIIMVIADGLAIVLVFILSITGYGYRSYDRFDIGCGVLGVIAIIAWQLTGTPLIAIILSVVADGFAALPTIRKAYADPWSEHPTGWAFTTVAAVVGIASTTQWDATNLIFPAYLAVVNGLTFTLAFIGRRRTLVGGPGPVNDYGRK